MTLLTSLLIILLLIIAGAFFSLAEISVAASKRARLEVYEQEGVPGADKVIHLQNNPSGFFTVGQIGLNCVGIITGMVVEDTLSPHIARLLAFFYNQPAPEMVVFITTFTLILITMILFSDIIPKRLAMMYPEKIAMRTMPIVYFLIKILTPFIWLFNGLSRVIFILFKIPQEYKDIVTTDEVEAVVKAGARSGALLEQEHAMIEHVLNLESRNIFSSMTPRDEIAFVDRNATKEELLNFLLNTSFSKVLVCNTSLDDIKGAIETADILKRLFTNQECSLLDPTIIRPVLMLPDNLNLWEALEQLNAANTKFSVVLNEYGMVVGVLTTDDITQVLMGNLVATASETQLIIQKDENSWLMDGICPVDDVIKALGLNYLPDEQEFETLGGFMITQLRRIPQPRDSVEALGFHFEVVDVNQQKIHQVLVTRVEPLETPTTTEET